MKLLLLGDVCPTEYSREAFGAGDVKTLFGETTELFQRSDYSFVNLECAITQSRNQIAKFGPCLAAPPETAQTLKKLGVDCCGLSNNHVFDFGREGLADTVRALEQAGIAYTGIGENYEASRKNHYVERNGERIAIVAVCEKEFSYALEDRVGARPFDEYDTLEDVRQAKRACDRVIVIYHGGKEYCRYPSPRVYRLCRALVRAGADVVLCQHSHCVVTYENYQQGHILHGQGNFHFTKPNSFDGWFSSLAVLYDTAENTVELIPVVAGEDRIDLARGAEKEEILQGLEERNRKLASGEWKQGWHDFCVQNAQVYTNSIGKAMTETSTERQNALFSHYLDCQAHTDVWRELFPTYNLTNERE